MPFNLLKFKDMVRVNVACFAHKALYHALSPTLTNFSIVLIEFIAVAPDMQIIFIPGAQVLVTFIVCEHVLSVLKFFSPPYSTVYPPNLRKNSAEDNEKLIAIGGGNFYKYL